MSRKVAFAQDIDSRLAKLMFEIPYHVGIAGSAPSSVASITALRKKMNDNKVPMAGRNLVLDTAADAKLLELDAFNRVDASGTDAAIRNAELGTKFGFTRHNISKQTKRHGKRCRKLSDQVNWK